MKTSVVGIPQKIFDEENDANRVFVVNQGEGSEISGLPLAAWRSEKQFGQVLMEIGNQIRKVRVRRD